MQGCPTPKPGVLNVHLVSHSHDDLGWLKTVDQYYYGANNTIQRAGVQYILDSVMEELFRDPVKRFIQVETGFFAMWWAEQSEEMKEKVRVLIEEGRLEFIGGGWSMNDEATAHYSSIIDNVAWGMRRAPNRLRYLAEEFGTCGRPRVAWQIDPFGHSREQAAIFAGMGFDGLFFGRLDYRDKEQRVANKTMEIVWHGTEDFVNDPTRDLFTGVLFNHYSPPPGFCFDILCDDVIIDNPRSPGYNVPSKVDEFVTWAEKASAGFRTKHVMATMGNDFNYQDAHVWYKNLDKLIKYVNEQRGDTVHLLYSTPSCYLKSIQEDSSVQWPEKMDDFFPYASDNNSYWTGYFSSRPTFKRFIRTSDLFLQVVASMGKQLGSAFPSPGSEENLSQMREVMGVNMHHDAVTGTAKQHVTDDYYRLISLGLDATWTVVRDALKSMMGGGGTLEMSHCPFLNISSCEVSENENTLILTLYNPLGRPRMSKRERHPSRHLCEMTPSGHVLPSDGLTPFPYVYPALTHPPSRCILDVARIDPFRPDQARESWVPGTIMEMDHFGKQLGSAFPSPGSEENLSQMREVMGVNMHHDAVTGTAKQHVTDDYYRLISLGLDATWTVVRDALKSMMGGGGTLEMSHCPFLNISSCEVSENENTLILTLYNPLGRPRSHPARVPVPPAGGGDAPVYHVYDHTGAELTVDVMPIPGPVLTVPGRSSSAKFELVFLASLPPMGFANFYITRAGSKSKSGVVRKTEILDDDAADFTLSNSEVSVTFNGETRMTKGMKRRDTRRGFTQELLYYNSMEGNNSEAQFRASGAYILRPNGTDPVSPGKASRTIVYRGDVVEEVHQEYGSWLSQVVRLYGSSPWLEVKWLVGPIPFQDGVGKEVINRMCLDMATGGKFHTDSNGRESLTRTRDTRESFTLGEEFEPVAGNYYPINSRLFLRDEAQGTQFTVLTDRAQGGGSIHDGELELMIHRRCLYDDAFGVEEALNETAHGEGLVASGSHYALLSELSEGMGVIKEEEKRIFYEPLPIFSPTTMTLQDFTSAPMNQRSLLKTALPEGINLLTLENWRGGSLLLRLEHFVERKENGQPVTLDIKDLFVDLDVVSVEEVTLDGNKPLDSTKRLCWKTAHQPCSGAEEKLETNPDTERLNTVVTLEPMTIRSFLLETAASNAIKP
ncbi:unnamed protein product [Darwinula stevensoni]|uniref:Alpha-mannosidase n=1 Tax=Darwinula stevensoni TaxID=69355 RepID=A0A7R8X0J2_9CRUS|nr:unnamed protein product [Darwinula stevensoni]CAG0879219.1 unnamed protein product [Darwinula stevensoni]